MRIRKNARLVLGGGSSASSSSSSSSFLVCQLNRSPWDAIDAFSLLQVDGDDGLGLNANTTTYFVNSIPPSDRRTYSLPSGESMELSFEYVEKPPAVPQPPKREREEDEIAGLEQDMNGCRFELNESYPTPLPPPPLPQKVEPPPPPSGPKRRGRPRKPTSGSAAAAAAVATAPNPYEFYYYSGFGPQWGKRRGGHRSSSSATAAAGAKISHESEVTTTTTAFETPGSSTTTHMYMMSEDEEDLHHSSNNNSNGKMKMKCANNKDNGVDLLDSVADGEIDYIEDDDDDEDERGLYGSGRRARKPIKARSLKSLM